MKSEFYKEYVNRIADMRDEGMTFQAIADIYGVSKQAVCNIYYRYNRGVKGMRGKGFNIERIVFKGIYEHFKRDLFESLTSFGEKVMGHKINYTKRISDFITGKSNSELKLSQIQKICEITGMSFEECFERRDIK